MSGRIALQKCWNHSGREAVARCPECRHAYCRECVVEHEDQVICAACLARVALNSAKRHHPLSLNSMLRVVCAGIGLLLAWFVFFGLGRMLLSVPDEFHADALWKRALSQSMRGHDQ